MTAKDGETDADNIEGYRMIYDLTGQVLEVFRTLHCMELQGLEIEGEENPDVYKRQ